MSNKHLSNHLRTCTNSKCRQSECVTISKAFQPNHHPLLNVECLKCGTIWLVCTMHNMKWCRRRYKSANDHLKNVSHHTHFVSNNDNYCIPINNDHSESESMDHDSLDNLVLENIYPLQDSNNFAHDNSISSNFLKNEINNTFSGLRIMINNAFSGTSSSTNPECSLEEINFHLHGLKFTMSMSQKQRFYFTYHNSLLLSALKVNNSLSDDAFKCSRPPLDIYDINMFYYSRKTSIYKNIPHPQVFCLHNHACVSIKDIIIHMFAFGLEIDGMILNTSLSTNNSPLIGPQKDVLACKQSMEIREKVRSRLRSHRQSISPLIVYITLWSDDFEPNNVIKHKRKSWLKTITIAPPEHSKVSHHYNYIIAIGSSKHNHEPIHAHFCDELKDLQKINYIYSSIYKKNIPIVVETMAICADRPERSSMNKMLNHNGSSSARWKYSCIINEPERLKSCNKCINIRARKVYSCLKGLPNSINNILCNDCCNWNFKNKLMKTTPPEKYPTKKNKDSPPAPKHRGIATTSNFKIGSIELTYKSLKEASIFTIYNVYTKKWNKGTAYAYLKCVGINNSFSKKNIVKYAFNCRNDENLCLQDCLNGFELPSFWNGPHLLHQCVDAPMHLLFLGIVKSLMTITTNWLTNLPSPKYKKFGDKVNPLLKKISKLNISWIRINAFNSPREYTLGGWISSHYSAFCRIMCIIYATVRDIIPPGNTTIIHFERMIVANNLCVSLLLSKDNTYDNTVLDVIKIFLSMVDMFENKSLQGSSTNVNSETESSQNSKNLTWMKSNFLSILNLPFQIKQFGHLRYFWDGNHERTIQNIKPYLKRARSTDTYFKTKMEEMYTNQFIDIVSDYFYNKCNSLNQVDFEYPEYKVYDRYGEFKVYTPTTDFMNLVNRKHPISGILIKQPNGNEIIPLVCQRNSDSVAINCYQVKFEESNGYYHMGHYFIFVDEFTFFERYDTKGKIDEICYSYMMMIPDIHDENSDENGYTIITENWKSLRKDNKYDFVLFGKGMFSNIK